jgi:SAM-dependent methyltransferase
MDLSTFHALLSAEGQALLARAMALPDLREETLLRHLTAFRREADPALAAAALETALLRRRAAAKFTRADRMYFTREALEQASAEVVARYRARRYASYPHVADLCCGIGGDAIALAGVVPRVIAVDRDPLRLAMAREGAAAYDVAERIRFVAADVRVFGTGGAPAAFFDPARRAAGRRLRHVERYEPPLSVVRDWRSVTPAIGVKLSPAVDPRELAALELDGELEFISVEGELREAALWLGPLRTAARRATLLPAGHTLTETGAPPPPVAPPGRYLLEPDPAVYRAGLLAELAAQLRAWQIDPTIAYLSTDMCPDTPFARVWRVEETLPFSVKGVRRRLRELGVGAVTVKKRGSPLAPETFTRLLRLKGTAHRTVFLTRVAGRPAAIIAVGPGEAGPHPPAPSPACGRGEDRHKQNASTEEQKPSPAWRGRGWAGLAGPGTGPSGEGLPPAGCG